MEFKGLRIGIVENGAVNSMTPHEVEQLVSLRISLEDALSRAKGASKYRRGAAIVALDATVERASSIVAITRGVIIPANGKLDDLISRLVQDFGSAWKPNVLPDIRHLRRARNASQHEGLEPDREQVPLWASAADVYVSTLIDAQFSVDVRRVVLSDAIRGVDLRKCIQEADEALKRGEYGACVDKAKEAYQEALTRWKRLRGGHGNGFAPVHGDIFDKKGFDFLSGQLDNMQSVLEAAAFSADLAESEWFTTAIADQSDVMNADDAERVLSFSFEWVVEYERAADSWTPNRRHRAAVSRRMTSSGDGPARIEECVSVDLHHGRVRALFRIADVPADEDGYELWAQKLRGLLPTRDSSQWWTVMDDGTVEIYKAIESNPDFSAVVTVLASALDLAHAAAREKLEEIHRTDQVAEQKRREYAELFEASRNDLPDWVEDIEWSDAGVGPGSEQLLLTVSEEVGRLKFGERSQHSFFDDRQSLRDLILNHELVQQCYWTGGSHDFGIMPILDAGQLRIVFTHVDAAVREQLEIVKGRNNEQTEALVAARVSIAAKLAELS